MNIWEGYVRVELYISGERASGYLALLNEQKDQIEQELGYQLDWGDQSDDARDKRISRYKRDINLENRLDWDSQHKWIATNLNAMHQVFANRIKNL